MYSLLIGVLLLLFYRLCLILEYFSFVYCFPHLMCFCALQFYIKSQRMTTMYHHCLELPTYFCFLLPISSCSFIFPSGLFFFFFFPHEDLYLLFLLLLVLLRKKCRQFLSGNDFMLSLFLKGMLTWV